MTIAFSALQKTEAVSYYGHDGSVDEYLEKVVVKPMKGKKDLWFYNLKACATTHNIAIATVTLKSDIDQIVLGVNKVIKKGDCSYYGAVMKAKDGNTLGATMLQKHEALDRMEEILEEMQNKSKKERQVLFHELVNLHRTTGGLMVSVR